MKSISLKLVLLAILTVFFTGCLTVDTKEYHYKQQKMAQVVAGSNLTISNYKDGENDVSLKDFSELIDEYVKGTKFEDENPALQVTSKELIEEKRKIKRACKI